MLQTNARSALHRTLLAAVIFCLGAVPARAQGTLRYKFKDGEQLRYEVQQDVDSKMNAQGKEMGMKMHYVIEVTWKFTNVEPDGKAKLVQKFDRIQMTMEGPPGKIEYDSKMNRQPEGEIGEAMASIFNVLTGSEFTSTMDTRGETSNMQIPDKVLEVVRNKVAKVRGFGEMFSPENMKRMVSQGVLVLPKDPVSKGQNWTFKTDGKIPFGIMHVTNKMTYEGPAGSKGLEKIGIVPSVVIEPDPNAPFKLKMKTNTGEGTAIFDNDAGRIVQLNMVQNMEADVNAFGRDMTQSSRTTMLLKLKK